MELEDCMFKKPSNFTEKERQRTGFERYENTAGVLEVIFINPHYIGCHDVSSFRKNAWDHIK